MLPRRYGNNHRRSLSLDSGRKFSIHNCDTWCGQQFKEHYVKCQQVNLFQLTRRTLVKPQAVDFEVAQASFGDIVQASSGPRGISKTCIQHHSLSELKQWCAVLNLDPDMKKVDLVEAVYELLRQQTDQSINGYSKPAGNTLSRASSSYDIQEIDVPNSSNGSTESAQPTIDYMLCLSSGEKGISKKQIRSISVQKLRSWCGELMVDSKLAKPALVQVIYEALSAKLESVKGEGTHSSDQSFSQSNDDVEITDVDTEQLLSQCVGKQGLPLKSKLRKLAKPVLFSWCCKLSIDYTQASKQGAVDLLYEHYAQQLPQDQSSQSQSQPVDVDALISQCVGKNGCITKRKLGALPTDSLTSWCSQLQLDCPKLTKVKLSDALYKHYDGQVMSQQSQSQNAQASIEKVQVDVDQLLQQCMGKQGYPIKKELQKIEKGELCAWCEELKIEGPFLLKKHAIGAIYEHYFQASKSQKQSSAQDSKPVASEAECLANLELCVNHKGVLLKGSINKLPFSELKAWARGLTVYVTGMKKVQMVSAIYDHIENGQSLAHKGGDDAQEASDAFEAPALTPMFQGIHSGVSSHQIDSAELSDIEEGFEGSVGASSMRLNAAEQASTSEQGASDSDSALEDDIEDEQVIGVPLLPDDYEKLPDLPQQLPEISRYEEAETEGLGLDGADSPFYSVLDPLLPAAPHIPTPPAQEFIPSASYHPDSPQLNAPYEAEPSNLDQATDLTQSSAQVSDYLGAGQYDASAWGELEDQFSHPQEKSYFVGGLKSLFSGSEGQAPAYQPPSHGLPPPPPARPVAAASAASSLYPAYSPLPNNNAMHVVDTYTNPDAPVQATVQDTPTPNMASSSSDIDAYEGIGEQLDIDGFISTGHGFDDIPHGTLNGQVNGGLNGSGELQGLMQHELVSDTMLDLGGGFGGDNAGIVGDGYDLDIYGIDGEMGSMVSSEGVHAGQRGGQQ